MSSSEAGLVRTSVQRAQDLAWTEHAADYGAKSPDWLANFDRATSSWKTAQTCLASTGELTLAEFSETWPRSGTMQNGTAYRLPPLTHPTSVIASGLWRTGEELLPTPTCAGNMLSPSMAKWPKHQALRESLLPTLHGTPNRDNPRRQGPSGNELGREVFKRERLLPTPTARDWRSGHASEATHARPNARPLNETVVLQEKLWPTPTASRRSGLQSHGENAILGTLNPTWVEWMFGLPMRWTALGRSETAIHRSSRKQSRER